MNDFTTFRIANVSKRNMDIFTLGQIVTRLDKCGLLLCRQGTIELLIDDKHINLKKGDVYIYMPSALMRPICVSDDAEGIMASIDLDVVMQVVNKVSTIESILFLRDNPCVTMTDEQFKRIESSLVLLDQTMKTTTFCFNNVTKFLICKEKLNSMGLVVLYDIIDIFFDHKPKELGPQSKKDIIFFRFLVSLYKNYTHERDVTFYAQEQSLTPRYFSSIIKEKSGNSALQWIVNVVIGDIKKQLELSDVTIKEIAVNMNFGTQSFFGKYFKQYVGLSPKEYRAQVKKIK